MKIRKLLTFLSVLMLLASTASAQDITYLDASGAQQTASTYTTVKNNTSSWSSGWYVVSQNTTISDRISVSGTVHLILCNGATLTASEGITVGSSASFNIYAQSEDEATMGSLVATATEYSYNSAIGGCKKTSFGTININGGKIVASTNSSCGAAIGGSYQANGGNITINGGIITATAGKYSYGAGIGGGYNGYVSNITLNGGIINATGDPEYGGAGIGTGAYAGNGNMTITITNNVKGIVASNGYSSDCIGKESHSQTTVNVVFKHNGNEVTGDAKNVVFYDTGEGASSRTILGNVTNHRITISDDIKASVTASVAFAPKDVSITLTLGSAVDVSTLSVKIGSNNLTLTNIGNRQYTFVMPDADVTVTATVQPTYSVTLPTNFEIVSATNSADANGKYISGTKVTFKVSFPYTASYVSDGTNTLTASEGFYIVTIDNADITITATTQRSKMIDLSDASSDFTTIANDILTGSTSHTVTIASNASITLNNATITGGIICEGNATITLVGNNNVTGRDYYAGVQVGSSGTTLTIKGDGSLTATGGDYAAGIGTDGIDHQDAICGNIVIESGTIIAQGGEHGGAGIGTGYASTYSTLPPITKSIGNIIIKGGVITATGSRYSPITYSDGIGCGIASNYGTTIVDNIIIYDGITKVEASRIGKSPVFMHETTDVTANKSDYFAIIEDGDRRVLASKDNTDYTITLAGGTEHGTISCAETAKYMDKVIVTATPDFGYRLSELVVKDADNNDVELYANSFFMPKSNVTVSAVFEQVTHGTTEFKWRKYSCDDLDDYVEETIYDGVTTVNIQSDGQWYYYNILKHEDGYPSFFLLDNDQFDVGIPYAGGTGAISYVPTNFNNYGNAGYYDITMTDVGNGKWNVSIQKTAGQMDVVPDQTYTGSEIKPEPLVMAGSLNLTKGTDYEYSYTDNVNVGTAKVTVTFKSDYASLGSVEKTFNITPKVTTLGALTLTQDQNGTTATLQGEFASTETTSLNIENLIEVSELTFQRTFKKGIPATIMLPFNFTLDASIGSFYTIESVAKNDNGEWIATPKVVTGTLQANTPYMFKAARDLKELSFTDENGITLQSTSTIEINTNGDWTLHGVYEKTMLDGDGEFNYGFAGQAVTAEGISVGDFIRAGEGVWADPMRCYLTYKKGELTKAATVLPDRIRVVFPDEVNSNNETTDIIENTETEDVVTPVSEFTPESGVKVWSFDGTVYIEAQPDMDYTIVDLTGRTIKSGVTHSTREELTLNTKGIVIVKIGNKTFKLK